MAAFGINSKERYTEATYLDSRRNLLPIVWRYLLGRYLKVLFLCLTTFICILLVSRLREIAQFAVLGGAGYYVSLFTLHQIPYILPIALPISCLISAIILYQHMSSTQELTALRASGLSLKHITAPTLIAGGFLALVNLYIVSEVSSYSRRSTSRLEYEVKALSPLLLLQNRNYLRHKSAYIDVQGEMSSGEWADEVILALNQSESQRISLLLAKRIHSTDHTLSANQVTLISGAEAEDTSTYDHLLIENLQEVDAPLSDFSYFMKQGGWRLKNDHFELSLLLIRLRQAVQAVQMAVGDPGIDDAQLKTLKNKRNACFTELSRRISVGLAVFTFSLMGCTFGVSISRMKNRRGALIVSTLALLYLVCFFVAKGLPEKFLLATVLYLIPHVLISALSVRALRRALCGIE